MGAAAGSRLPIDAMTEEPNLNAGKPWSGAVIRDLRRCVALGDPIEDIASFLCRTQQEVRAKAAELELRLPWNEHDDCDLKAELEAGRSIEEAANKLTRSREDIERRMRKLGFPDRCFRPPNEGRAEE